MSFIFSSGPMTKTERTMGTRVNALPYRIGKVAWRTWISSQPVSHIQAEMERAKPQEPTQLLLMRYKVKRRLFCTLRSRRRSRGGAIQNYRSISPRPLDRTSRCQSGGTFVMHGFLLHAFSRFWKIATVVMIPSCPRRPASSKSSIRSKRVLWTPACAGVTNRSSTSGLCCLVRQWQAAGPVIEQRYQICPEAGGICRHAVE